MENKTQFYLCLFGGIIGLHRFAKGQIGKGFLYMFTAGLFIFGWLYDLFCIYNGSFDEKVERQKQAVLQQRQAIQDRQIAQRERIQDLRDEGVPFCPRCKSTHLTANKKGYGFGKGFVGTAAFGVLGAFAGGIGSGKVKITCMNCGHQFKPRRR